MSIKRFIVFCLFLNAGLGAMQAQEFSLTTPDTTYAADGGTTTFTVRVSYSGTLAAVGFELTAPAGWSYQSASGANLPTIRPVTGTTGNFEFAYQTVPVSPITFTFTLGYAAGLTGNRSVTGITAQLRSFLVVPPVMLTAPDIVLTLAGGGGGGGGGGGSGLAPSIVLQPAGASVNAGASLTLSVAATGTAPLAYQWRRDGVAISGETRSSLVLANVTAGAGYSVVVSNSAGSVTSAVAVVSVKVPESPPVITVAPRDFTGAAGSPVTLTVAATGAEPLSYQWRKDGVALAGATGATLALSGAASGAGSYTVVVANAAGSVTSPAAIVRFVDGTPAPVITQQPVGRSLAVGASTALLVQATGAGTLAYQWLKNGVPLAGETAGELTLRDVGPAAAGDYQVQVSSGASRVLSAVARIVVFDRPVAPVVSLQPAPTVALAGADIAFAVAAAGNPVPTYQWRKNGTPVAGATTARLALSAVQPADAGGYDVVVSNAAGVATSSLASLAVVGAAQPPVITRQPVGVALAAGRTVRLAVAATGAPAPIWQWRRDGQPIAGATTAELTMTGMTPGQAGVYSVTVANSAGSVTSNEVIVSVFPRSYAGAYFGQITGGGGSFALWVRDDHTGVWLAYATTGGVAFLQRRLTIDEFGRFRFTANGTGAGNEAVFDGAISSIGTVGGTVSGVVSGSLFGAKAAENGATAAYAGFYQLNAADAAAQVFALVGPAGRAFVLTQAGGGAEGGEGEVSAGGRMALTLPTRAGVNLEFFPENGGAAGRVRSAGGVETPVSGYSEQAPARAEQRLANISTRTTIGAGDDGVVIVGFVVDGVESKPVLIRAIGPTLRDFGVATALSAPRLVLLRTGTTVASNTGWSTAPNAAEIVAATTRAGAFALAPASADSAVLTTLAPGSYTAVVSAADGRAGVGLVEVYDLGGASNDQKLVNISTRAVAGTGDATLIAGVVVAGREPKRVLIRAAGPALAAFGVGGALARPVLKIYSGERLITENAGWSGSLDAAMIAEAGARVGAFAFPAASADAAVIVNLAPGTYTAVASSATGATGTALIEVYEVP